MRKKLSHGCNCHAGERMIHVKIFAPSWCKLDVLDERGWTDLPEGSTLTDALNLIHMPKIMAKLLQGSINGEVKDLNTALKDGDVIGFFALMVGG
jgi:molybdopterin converting factor small subunit